MKFAAVLFMSIAPSLALQLCHSQCKDKKQICVTGPALKTEEYGHSKRCVNIKTYAADHNLNGPINSVILSRADVNNGYSSVEIFNNNTRCDGDTAPYRAISNVGCVNGQADHSRALTLTARGARSSSVPKASTERFLWRTLLDCSLALICSASSFTTRCQHEAARAA